MRKPKAVAYCRVSTNKNAQLDSLEAQVQFFEGYAQQSGYELIDVYADPGKSGVKIKNRTALLKLLADAKGGKFETVLIKDVSRLARNTVDFLTSIRTLKALGIKVVFVNYDQSSSESSEFMLTLLSAIAQEESANTSKRVKFGKAMNAKQGKVPNLVYGYEKIPGDYFNLTLVPEEAKVVENIFMWYSTGGMGAHKIAQTLNTQGIRTKRGNKWSQNAISRVLSNALYVGQVINGKERVADFLTGKREKNDETQWQTTYQEKFRIISDELYDKVQVRLKENQEKYIRGTRFRETAKHPLSNLLICESCGASFKRLTRTYKNTYVKWVCGKRNTQGKNACANTTGVEEQALLEHLAQYLQEQLADVPYEKWLEKELGKLTEKAEGLSLSPKAIEKAIKKEERAKEKYKLMFENDIIDLSELKIKNQEIATTLETLYQQLNMTQAKAKTDEQKPQTLNHNHIQTLLTNETLKQYLSKCTITPTGQIHLHLKPL